MPGDKVPDLFSFRITISDIDYTEYVLFDIKSFKDPNVSVVESEFMSIRTEVDDDNATRTYISFLIELHGL